MPPNPEADIVPDVMSDISLPCSVEGCGYVTKKLAQAVAASILSSHTMGNHNGPAPPRGRRNDRLQKLDRPILITGCCQQDFGFVKEEWRRYSDSSDTLDENLLRDQLLQCVETSLRKTLQNTIGTARMATI